LLVLVGSLGVSRVLRKHTSKREGREEKK
jgi:hypothetical protein